MIVISPPIERSPPISTSPSTYKSFFASIKLDAVIVPSSSITLNEAAPRLDPTRNVFARVSPPDTERSSRMSISGPIPS